MTPLVRVQAEDFDPGALLAEVEAVSSGTAQAEGIGAVASFTGLVRADKAADGGVVRAMTLEHYPGMTERMLAAIATEAGRRWPLHAVTIVHRFGRLEPGARIVFVATAAAHRAAAFEACAFLVDWLKTKAPFWKLEEAADGASHWVDAKAEDDAAAARWDG